MISQPNGNLFSGKSFRVTHAGDREFFVFTSRRHLDFDRMNRRRVLRENDIGDGLSPAARIAVDRLHLFAVHIYFNFSEARIVYRAIGEQQILAFDRKGQALRPAWWKFLSYTFPIARLR